MIKAVSHLLSAFLVLFSINAVAESKLEGTFHPYTLSAGNSDKCGMWYRMGEPQMPGSKAFPQGKNDCSVEISADNFSKNYKVCFLGGMRIHGEPDIRSCHATQTPDGRWIFSGSITPHGNRRAFVVCTFLCESR